MRFFASSLVVAALAAPLAPQDPTPPKAQPPSRREIDALVERFFALDPKTEQGYREQEELLARLALVPPLEAKEAEKWREKLLKEQREGRELEKKGGRHWYWEDEERGLYYVGGKTRRPKGLFIGMHGGGKGQGDASSSLSTWSSAVGEMDWVGVFPEVLEKTEHGWTTSGTEEWVIDLVEAAKRTWDIDPDRVYFGGHSMGGYGTWMLGAHHQDVVAGLTPSAGAPTPVFSGGEVVDVIAGVIPNLRNTRIRIYQSDDDRNVPPEANRMAAKKLAEAQERWGGYDFEYWEVPGRGHDTPPGGVEALLEKVADAVRNPRPEKIVWQATKAWKRHCYWLYWDAPVFGTLIEAELDREANTVRVSADASPEGMWVLLDDELLDLDREVVVSFGGEEVWRGVPERALATLVLTGQRNDARLMFDARVPLWADAKTGPETGPETE